MSDTSRVKLYLKVDALQSVRDRNIPDGIRQYLEYLAFDANKDDDDAWAGLGGAYRRLGDIDKSIESYQTAFDINPKSTYALVNLVSLLAARNDNKDKARLQEYAQRAQVLCQEIIDAKKGDHWTWYDLATLQLIAGNLTDSQAAFTYAIFLTPKDAKENFRSVLANLTFLQQHNPAIVGISEVIGQIDSELRAAPARS